MALYGRLSWHRNSCLVFPPHYLPAHSYAPGVLIRKEYYYMALTFQFIISSIENLFPHEFYLFPLVLSCFVLLISIVKNLKKK